MAHNAGPAGPSDIPSCPMCGETIPSAWSPGAYPGALSRIDNETEVCSRCGHVEGYVALGDLPSEFLGVVLRAAASAVFFERLAIARMLGFDPRGKFGNDEVVEFLQERSAAEVRRGRRRLAPVPDRLEHPMQALEDLRYALECHSDDKVVGLAELLDPIAEGLEEADGIRGGADA